MTLRCSSHCKTAPSRYTVRFARWLVLTITLLLISAVVAHATSPLVAEHDTLASERHRFTKFIHNLIPLGDTANDLTPFIIMAALLVAAGIITWYRPKAHWARRTVQTISAVAFIIGIHPCGCMTRDVVLGIGWLSFDDVTAFKYLIVFVTAGAFAAVLGRGFCGWVCPLGFMQEITGGVTRKFWRHVEQGSILPAILGTLAFLVVVIVTYVFLIALGAPGTFSTALVGMATGAETLKTAAVIVAVSGLIITIATLAKSVVLAKYLFSVQILAAIIYAFYKTKPGTYVFIEYAMVFFVMGLSLIVLSIITNEKKDRFFKRLRYPIWIFILVMYFWSFYNVGPMCLFFQGSREWPVLISFGGVFLLSALLIMPWCRYMCPEGTAFSLVARKSAWQINRTEACTECGACDEACPMACIEKGIRDKTSCIACCECISACPDNALVVENEIRPRPQPEPRVAPLPGFKPATQEKK